MRAYELSRHTLEPKYRATRGGGGGTVGLVGDSRANGLTVGPVGAQSCACSHGPRVSIVPTHTCTHTCTHACTCTCTCICERTASTSACTCGHGPRVSIVPTQTCEGVVRWRHTIITVCIVHCTCTCTHAYVEGCAAEAHCNLSLGSLFVHHAFIRLWAHA